MTIIQDISAGLTDYARELIARGLAEAVMLGDWSFQVGTYGFDPLNPDETYDVDFSLQTLTTPVGGTRYLGRLLDSGFGASVALSTPGFLQVNGLTASTISMARKWLRISGSANPLLNGTWVVSARVSSTSILISNPMVTTADAGPLSWELREAVCMNPNPRAIDFHGNLEAPDATVDGLELGEVGIFGRVLRAPSVPLLVGTSFMFAHANHPAIAKFAEMYLGHHVCTQC